MPFSDERRLPQLQIPLARQLVRAGAAVIGKRYDIPPRGDRPPLPRLVLENALPLAMSLALVAVTTAGLLLIDRLLPANLIPIVYLVPVIVAATRWGTWPAIAAAIASAATADFFFFPPYYSFRLDDPHAAIDLLLFLLVALVSGDLASRLRRETETLRLREVELQYLHEFSRRLAACFTVSDLIGAIQSYLFETFGSHTAFFLATADKALPSDPVGAVPERVRLSAASMMSNQEIRATSVRDGPAGSLWLLRAVGSEEAIHGVIAVNIGFDTPEVIDQRTRRVEAILAEASVTLQRLDIGGAMEEAELRLKDRLLRDAFHGNLSHELRSPLAAIRGSASVLETMPAIRSEHQARSLVDGITDEVERLDSFVGNLLNASRVTASDIRAHLECADPRDIVNAAMRRRSRHLAAHTIRIGFDDDLPMITVDSALVEEAFGQLLENAAKYSPPGSTISITAQAGPGRVILSISDSGAGITAEERAQLGRRSFRGERHRATVPGSGHGFWIASTFVKANDGSIDITSEGEGKGTTASIILPEAVIEDEWAGSNDE
jgi:two-component system, OmpR family, sensor histidine kinase KdpD